MSKPVEVEALSETALLLHFGDGIDAQVNAAVHAAAAAIRARDLDAITDVVPAYASVLACHRPLTADARHVLIRQLQDAVSSPSQATTTDTPCHDIPVCYGGEHGSDLTSLADACGLTEDEVVARHAAGQYRVAMTGFAPGFPYLIGLDPTLATPRLATPRTRVPAGSVGIAGAQTGIYPSNLPGGWQLIGRTPCRLFRPDQPEQPCLLMPGDQVRFHAIDGARFREWAC